MTVSKRIHHELSRLESAPTSAKGPQVVGIVVETDRFEVEVEAIDSIACALRRIQLITRRLEDATVDQLKGLGESLASRLIYLLEPISPVEIDEEGATVQLRSNPPLKNEDGANYFELMVRRSGVTMCRYHKTPGEVRQVVAAQFTREVVARLADDFLETVASF